LENQGDILKRVKKIEKALEGNEKGAAKMGGENHCSTGSEGNDL
jgi:hypothetical protein